MGGLVGGRGRYGSHAIFVSRLVGGDHFELANGGQPGVRPRRRRAQPRHRLLGNIPYVSWQTQVGAERRTVSGHFESLTSFKVDTVGALQRATERVPLADLVGLHRRPVHARTAARARPATTRRS